MQDWLRRRRPLIKTAIILAVLGAVGWRFARDFRDPSLWQRRLDPGWLVASGVLYLVGIGCSALFWHRLLGATGQNVSVPAALRAYYVGQLGKYVPGKAWALLLRCALVRGQGVRLGAAAATTLYEVLTTMAAGVLLAVGLVIALVSDSAAESGWPLLRYLFHYLFTTGAPKPAALDRSALLILASGLLVIVGLPLLPPLFNRVARRFSSLRAMAGKAGGPFTVPAVPTAALPQGLLITGVGWLFLGASLWAALHAVLPHEIAWAWDVWGRFTAYLAMAFVAGFVIMLPGGIGVRELLLTLFLFPEIARLLPSRADEAWQVTVLAVLLLRLAWTAAEVVAAGVLYSLGGSQVAAPAPTNVLQDARS